MRSNCLGVHFVSFVLFSLTAVAGEKNLSLTEWNEKARDANITAMYVLGGWSIANLGASGVGMATTTGRSFNFHSHKSEFPIIL